MSQAQRIAYSKAFCKRTQLELDKWHLAEDSEMDCLMMGLLASENQVLHKTLQSLNYLVLSL